MQVVSFLCPLSKNKTKTNKQKTIKHTQKNTTKTSAKI